MSPEQALCLACILAAVVLGALALREALLDFAEHQFSDEFGGDRPHGDVPFIAADDLKTLFHATTNITGAEHDRS
jgi:glutathione S-transferase